jgi:hypothetical protein
MAQPVLKIEILKCRKSIFASLQFAEVAASRASPQSCIAVSSREAEPKWLLAPPIRVQLAKLTQCRTNNI